MKKEKKTGHGVRTLLIDVSNSFTKIALSRSGKIGRVRRIPTKQLKPSDLGSLKADRAVIASVVPEVSRMIAASLPCPPVWVDHRVPGGVSIDYPKPSSIGADRLANAAAAVNLGKLPAIVVDFGTAVTFDVIDAKGCYRGGVIAPGLPTAASALHERTALLPLTKITSIRSCLGKSTAEAIRIGLLLGAVGLVSETVSRMTSEVFGGKRPYVIATGGDAELVSRLSSRGGGKAIIDKVDPLLTLRGLQVIAANVE
ncbi:MAG: Type pantothenate kinase [Verrucomicrobiota bacterium]